MAIRIGFCVLLLSYQTLTMPCHACLLSPRGEVCGMACEKPASDHGAASCCQAEEVEEAAPCCCSEEESAENSPCCSEKEGAETNEATPSGKCCPMPGPCDNCTPVITDRPEPVRSLGEILGVAVIGQAAIETPSRLAFDLLSGKFWGFSHKSSTQAVLCIWLN